MTFASPIEKPSSGSPPGEGARAEHDWATDSLHILPLAIIPFESPGLKRARLVKDGRLLSVVELFHDAAAGSGRLDPDQLNRVFNWPQDPVHPDLATITALGELHSYDVFSLRIELRRLNIRVNDHSELRLSEEKNRELTKYMTEFTRPLIQQIYGNSEITINDANDLFRMFSNPNKEEALNNIRLMAEKLDIEMADVPAFLEDYGDIFLSLAYFKDQLDEIVPSIIEFTNSLNELKKNYQLRRTRNFPETCDKIEENFNDIMSSITGRFESFDRHSQNLWNNITAESFRKVKELIGAHHTTLGGVLCGLNVKMDAWTERFGAGHGGPVQRADFIMSEFMQGIDVIMRIEGQAPKLVAL